MIGELQIGDLYRTDPLGLQLSVEYWCPQDNYGAHETTYNVRPPQRQVRVNLTHFKSEEREYTSVYAYMYIFIVMAEKVKKRLDMNAILAHATKNTKPISFA